MRRINPNNFHIATRGTSREINRQIAFNLVRAHQPISRADLARVMGLRRGAVSLIVNDLLAERLIFEGSTGESMRGRKPTFLYIDTREQCVVAVDIRVTRTYMLVTDLLGRQLVAISSFPTAKEPTALVSDLSRRIRGVISEHNEVGICKGIGVVVPGMVDRQTSRIIHAPTLGWHDVEIRDSLASATGLPVYIENSGKACALAQMWAKREEMQPGGDLVFVSVSDGIGVGVIMNGEVLRGNHNIAGEFGHVPLNIDGPKCSCGATGCWEAYISNLATLTRYFGKSDRDSRSFTIEDSDCTGPVGRFEGARGNRGYCSIPRTGACLDRECRRSGANLYWRRDHCGVGNDRTDCTHVACRASTFSGRETNRDPNSFT